MIGGNQPSFSDTASNRAQSPVGVCFERPPMVRFNSGFTLIELLVTICVFAVIVAFAIPSFKNLLLNNRLNASTDALADALSFGRINALNRNMNVTVCPFSASNSTVCGNNWSNGWIVVTSPAAGAGTLIKSQENNTNIDPNISANNPSVTFNSHGLAQNQTNFTLCDSRGSQYGRSLEVMATGYTQPGQTAGQAVWNNTALVCP